MGKLADNSRASLDAAREATKAAWADFEEARTAATNGEGEIPADEVDALEAKHALYKATAADEATAEAMWERMVAIEGSGVAKATPPAVLEHGNGNGSGSGSARASRRCYPARAPASLNPSPTKTSLPAGRCAPSNPGWPCPRWRCGAVTRPSALGPGI